MLPCLSNHLPGSPALDQLLQWLAAYWITLDVGLVRGNGIITEPCNLHSCNGTTLPLKLWWDDNGRGYGSRAYKSIELRSCILYFISFHQHVGMAPWLLLLLVFPGC